MSVGEEDFGMGQEGGGGGGEEMDPTNHVARRVGSVGCLYK